MSTIKTPDPPNKVPEHPTENPGAIGPTKSLKSMRAARVDSTSAATNLQRPPSTNVLIRAFNGATNATRTILKSPSKAPKPDHLGNPITPTGRNPSTQNDTTPTKRSLVRTTPNINTDSAVDEQMLGPYTNADGNWGSTDTVESVGPLRTDLFSPQAQNQEDSQSFDEASAITTDTTTFSEEQKLDNVRTNLKDACRFLRSLTLLSTAREDPETNQYVKEITEIVSGEAFHTAAERNTTLLAAIAAIAQQVTHAAEGAKHNTVAIDKKLDQVILSSSENARNLTTIAMRAVGGAGLGAGTTNGSSTMAQK
ncbi:hypothetical protein GALMADRAFT_138272, partial [Galerina marginata CBS 339.88]